jgi:hypothetical protein
VSGALNLWSDAVVSKPSTPLTKDRAITTPHTKPSTALSTA